MDDIQLGSKMMCRVTGYVGTVVAITTFMFSARRVAIQAPMGADRKMPSLEWFDEAQLVTFSEG